MYTIISMMLLGCVEKHIPETTSVSLYNDLFANHPTYNSDGFDFPVGKPNAKGYRDAQPFAENNHSGEDWNGNGGGDSDLGDPIYAIANGWVSVSENKGGGWCNVVRVVHQVDGVFLESLYAHLDTMDKEVGEWVKRGEQIGTIGKCADYFAHLHLELRNQPDMPLGNGYSSEDKRLLSPTTYINAHRP